MAIEALEKPKGKWCPHCQAGIGCSIYETRPAECQTFHCGYLFDAGLGAEWKPSTCKIVLVFETEANRLVAQVDPSRADVWRQEPFFAALKGWSANAQRNGGQVLVAIGQRTFAILPDREIDLGLVDKSKVVVTTSRATPQGPRLEVVALSTDDPRLAEISKRQSPQRDKT